MATADKPPLVLLIEDNDDHAELVRRQLTDHQIANRIIRLSDGQEALDFMFKKGKYAHIDSVEQPRMIFLDLRLPKVDGLEVLRLLKESEELRKIPLIILTTSEAERDVARAYYYHANSYIVKPVDYDKFRALMNDLGFYWMSWNTPSLK